LPCTITVEPTLTIHDDKFSNVNSLLNLLYQSTIEHAYEKKIHAQIDLPCTMTVQPTVTIYNENLLEIPCCFRKQDLQIFSILLVLKIATSGTQAGTTAAEPS